jgi:tetratricopeptide (TPR) repeat protein
MFFPILLAALFALTPLAEAGQAPKVLTHAEAARVADEGRDAEALAAFQRLAAANPSDQVARLWIARLHARMGHQNLAEPVYRSVLLEDPNSVEAMTGVAAALIARFEPELALEMLERAAKLAPSNDEVLNLTGRAREQQGRSSEAITYFERAVDIAPTAPRRQTLEAARLSHLSRIELRGVSELFDDASPDTRGGDIALNVRLSDAVRIIARGQVERKFALDEQRGGGGLEWRVKPTTLLRGQVLVGPDNVVLPEGDFLGEIEHSYKNALWIGTLRHFTFNGASTTFISPAVDWMSTDRLSVGLRYALSFTDIGSLVSMEAGQSLHVRPVYRITPRVSLQGGYAVGVESFEDFAIDRIGDFRAQTLSGGIRFNLPILTSIVANYERQFWRRDDVTLSRVTLSLSQRF